MWQRAGSSSQGVLGLAAPSPQAASPSHCISSCLGSCIQSGLAHGVRRHQAQLLLAGLLGGRPEPRWEGNVLWGPEKGGKWPGVLTPGGQSQDGNPGLGCPAPAALPGHTWPWFGHVPWKAVLAVALFPGMAIVGWGCWGMALALG